MKLPKFSLQFLFSVFTVEAILLGLIVFISPQPDSINILLYCFFTPVRMWFYFWLVNSAPNIFRVFLFGAIFGALLEFNLVDYWYQKDNSVYTPGFCIQKGWFPASFAINNYLLERRFFNFDNAVPDVLIYGMIVSGLILGTLAMIAWIFISKRHQKTAIPLQ